MEKDSTYFQACAWVQGQLAGGIHPEAVVTALKNQGWEESQAREVLDGAVAGAGARPAAPTMAYATPVQAARRASSSSGGSSRHTTNMVIGGVICGIGIAITLITYNSASSSGGTYTVCWGAMIFGAFRFFRGLVGFASGS